MPQEGRLNLRIKEPTVLHKLQYAHQIKKIPDGQWKLGKRIHHNGGCGLLYHLQERHKSATSSESRVVKIVDLRLMNTEFKIQTAIRNRTQKEIDYMKELKEDNSNRHTSELLYACALKNHFPGVYCSTLGDEDPVIFFIVMPKYRAISAGELTETETIKLGIHICDALQFLFDKKILHRDIKPDNILLDPRAASTLYRLADFGIARPVTNSPHTGFCTKGYYPPEWADTPSLQNQNGDLYSLAVSMAILLGGRFLSSSENHTEIVGSLDWNYLVARGLACPALLEILKKGLAEYTQRYQTPNEMKADLEALYKYIELKGKGPDSLTLDEVKNSLKHATQPVSPVVPSAQPTADRLKDLIRKKQFREVAKLVPPSCNDPRLNALLAYSQLAVLRQGTADPTQRANLQRMLKSCCDETELDALQSGPQTPQRNALMRRAGAIKCILAASHYEAGDLPTFHTLLQGGADLGSPIANYILGRGLYTGDSPFRQDTQQGLIYLQNAANAGYRAAQEFLGMKDTATCHQFNHNLEDILAEL